jgi:malate dehydrogenase (oxaloacetate-decarboxylating)(NADP+)
LAWATWTSTAWAFRSASCSSTLRRQACRPKGLLPSYLDSGTNNETYLRDPLYLGLGQPRPSTEELYAFVGEFMEAVPEVFPNCCVHFEDRTGTDAIALLARYRDKFCC